MIESSTHECLINNAGSQSVCTPLKCGNGVIDIGDGENCDDRNRQSGDGCSDECLVEPGYYCNGNRCFLLCGNGQIDRAYQEQCDDRNTRPGDGCDGNCQVEIGYDCAPNAFGGSVCTLLCGNGVR